MTPPNYPYHPPRLYFNGHIETIVPALWRKIEGVRYRRERISTDDGDFLDLDWVDQIDPQRNLIIISHGLEGNTDRAYIKGMARALFQSGFEVLTWNYRSCSGEMNLLPRFYHSGATEDLHRVIQHAQSLRDWDFIGLVGFSLGGNLTLKYLGEQRFPLASAIQKAVVFSVPMHLHSSCLKLSTRENILYSKRFLKTLKEKIYQKEALMPGTMPVNDLAKIRDLMGYDDVITAPLHGFANALDYYTRNSSLQFVPDIHIPTLIVNASNDPFLTEECFPETLLRSHSKVQLEVPNRGGHVGFTLRNARGHYWSELRAVAFMNGN